MGISASEVLFSYAAEGNDNRHHLVKARYANISESSFSLNEEYHQSIDGQWRLDAFSLSENNETIWHAALLGYNIAYFQYNSNDVSLIGNKYVSNNYRGIYSLDIFEAGGYV